MLKIWSHVFIISLTFALQQLLWNTVKMIKGRCYCSCSCSFLVTCPFFLFKVDFNFALMSDLTQQDGASPSSAAEVRPSSQSRPITGGEITGSQNQDSQAAVVGSVARPSEEAGIGRPLSRCPAAEEKPALTAADDEGTNNDAATVRPVSNTSEKAAGPKSTIIL